MPSTLLLSCLGAVLLSALLVRFMVRVAVLDTPGHRSSHDRPTPKGGGVGVIAAFLLGTPLALRLQGEAISVASACLLAAVGLLALVSWLDDVRQFPPLVKLAAQLAAAASVLWGIWPLPGSWLPGFWPLGLAIGLCWLLFVTNALNFIDGLNGLAGGSMALACLWLGIGLGKPGGLEQTAALLLAAGLIGFLPFNYPRARIFLGDVGSQGAGLAVAAIGLLHWRDGPAHSLLAMPLLLAGILYDVAFTLCRRWRAGERLMQAHRDHLYQLAFRSGIPAWRIALLHWGFVLWGGAIARALQSGLITVITAILLALLPQLAWTGLVLRAARRLPGRW